jgi:large subunit ribosomal protein L17
MRHRIAGRKLNRTSAHRKATLMNLVSNLFTHEKIETTLPKAKEARCLAEKIITLGRDGSLAKRRLALSLLNNNKEIVAKVFSEYATRYKTRNGGYTRILKTNKLRLGDGTRLVIFEMVDRPIEVEPTEEVSAEAKTPKKEAKAKV